MFKHCMLDIETLGKSPDAAVVAIGAVAFETNVREDFESIRMQSARLFYTTINIDSCLKVGLKVDGSTLEWWFNQSEDARTIFKHQDELWGIHAALNEFARWRATVGLSEMHLWGNGATFDNVIIENAFRACNIRFPFTYQSHMCFRTMRRLLEVEGFEYKGLKHHALDDAINQAVYLQRVYDKFNDLKIAACS